MKRIAQIVPFFIGAVLVLSFTADKGPKSLKIGAKAPMAEVKMLAVGGEKIALNDAKMKNGLIVVFSCNTCPFVVGMDEFPGWEKDYNELNALATSNEIGFVLVNSNEAKRAGDDSFEKMEEKAKNAGYTMPYLVDEHSKLANAFGAKTTPHVYYFDSELKLVYVGSIDNTWDTKRTKDEAYLKDAIAQHQLGKIDTKESNPVGCSIKRVAAN